MSWSMLILSVLKNTEHVAVAFGHIPVYDVEMLVVVSLAVLIHDLIQQFNELLGEVLVEGGDGLTEVLVGQDLVYVLCHYL